MTLRPYYAEDGVEIYHGDCREILPQLTAGSVDLLLTDPPYGQQFQGAGLLTAKANIRADGARQGMRLVRQMLFSLLEEARVMRPDAHVYSFCHWESWPDFYDTFSSYIKIQNALIWHKNRGGSGDTEYEYARDFEVILYGLVGRGRPLIGRRDSAFLSGFPAVRMVEEFPVMAAEIEANGFVGFPSVISGIPPVSGDRVHPTEKPVKLFRYLIEKSSPPGGRILDTFGGAMPAAKAAKLTGREAVVIEIEKRYCQLGADMLSQQPMFSPPPIVPPATQIAGGLFGDMPDPVVRSYNRHADCAAAELAYLATHPSESLPIVNFHCSDEGCEDCFGQ